ncbi:hypothetical protein BGZ65_012942 [Modicella reniformis]|uniref:Uncharacterized protein n=1 Tax=Modicella reniformis TaxID=1440133 RepID=A0A9P6IMV8_9FUNG|nr:hypothetical protein BGZ65_012942 [Modicella reniformis]
MKFSITSVLGAASTAILLALSSVQVSALPTNPIAGSVTLEKRDIESLNNYDCKLTAAHPRPVVLIHGTAHSVDSWETFAPVLIKRGYCVFGMTYGKYKNIPIFGGLAPIEDNAKEVGDFINNVLAKMKVSQVDVVGHSQGGILARYWIKYLDGAGKVYRHVGISPINHGTTLSGIITLGKAVGLWDPLQSSFDSVAPSLYQMMTNSTFMQKLNAGGDTVPGVIFSTIATKYDEVVTPWETCYQTGSGVTNVLLQDLCAASLNEHLLITESKVVLQFVLNQLDPSTAKTANCLSEILL